MEESPLERAPERPREAAHAIARLHRHRHLPDRSARGGRGLSTPARPSTFIIGGDVGGGYDIYARVISRHLPRFIPGNPTIVPKNQPGAGSGRAASFIYSVAPKDGTVIGAVFPGAIMGPLLDDRAQPLYDPTKFQYLGSADNATRVCITHERSRIKTFDDALEAEGDHGRERGRRLDPRLRQHAARRRPARCSTWSAATRAPPTSFSPWSAARSTACAASTGRA